MGMTGLTRTFEGISLKYMLKWWHLPKDVKPKYRMLLLLCMKMKSLSEREFWCWFWQNWW